MMFAPKYTVPSAKAAILDEIQGWMLLWENKTKILKQWEDYGCLKRKHAEKSVSKRVFLSVTATIHILPLSSIEWKTQKRPNKIDLIVNLRKSNFKKKLFTNFSLKLKGQKQKSKLFLLLVCKRWNLNNISTPKLIHCSGTLLNKGLTDFNVIDVKGFKGTQNVLKIWHKCIFLMCVWICFYFSKTFLLWFWSY